jgi:hypothetical protein
MYGRGRKEAYKKVRMMLETPASTGVSHPLFDLYLIFI